MPDAAACTEGLSNEDFDRLRSLIYRESGINLGSDKKTMMEVRLKRRLRGLRLSSFEEYCSRVFSARGREAELVHLIDVITTNKTDFFREPAHFEFLIHKALPELARLKGAARRSLIWSAGCSTGEEPYTLAMLLSEYAAGRAGFRFDILATDICTEVLAKASLGIYKAEAAAPVPPDLRRRYFMRSRDPDSELLRVVPELRAAVEFRRLNFMDADFGVCEPVEMIFCRNVIIYFDRATQNRLLEKLMRHLAPGGFFFAGHSESLQAMTLPLDPVAPSVYRKHS
jgi:chemotaxis protein methyltransferase CheR